MAVSTDVYTIFPFHRIKKLIKIKFLFIKYLFYFFFFYNIKDSLDKGYCNVR